VKAHRSAASRWAQLGCGLFAAALLLSCGASASKDDYDSTDPLGDPFFADGFGGSSLDEVLHQPAPSVGWLENESLYDRERTRPDEGEDEMLGHERSAAGAGEVVEAERRNDLRERGEPVDDDDAGDEGARKPGSRKQKSFSQQAQEATLATMSVLIGAGMAALPYLLGT